MYFCQKGTIFCRRKIYVDSRWWRIEIVMKVVSLTEYTSAGQQTTASWVFVRKRLSVWRGGNLDQRCCTESSSTDNRWWVEDDFSNILLLYGRNVIEGREEMQWRVNSPNLSLPAFLKLHCVIVGGKMTHREETTVGLVMQGERQTPQRHHESVGLLVYE